MDDQEDAEDDGAGQISSIGLLILVYRDHGSEEERERESERAGGRRETHPSTITL